MTQEDKELLLKEICVRLPYGVKVAFFNEDLTYHSEPKTLTGFECINNLNYSSLVDEDGNTTIVEFVKPYLFPLSSMTEEQMEELKELCNMYTPDDDYHPYVYKGIKVLYKHVLDDNYKFNFKIDVIDWFNKNHFDYRGLIEKGLAIDATGLNIY
jgi:hypothetical protein